MKVFLSWSGSISHKVACALRDWLPDVLQSVEPYVSSEDIDKGGRWSESIAASLADAEFGIICVTPENIDSRWLNFEAGALSKDFETDLVSPFLIGLDVAHLTGPLTQFQCTSFDQHEVTQLVKSINRCNPLVHQDTKLESAVQKWWTELETKLEPLHSAAVKKEEVASSPVSSPESAEYVVETLEPTLTLILNRLSDPTTLVPRDHIVDAIYGTRLVVSQGGIDADELIELGEALESLIIKLKASRSALVPRSLIADHLNPIAKQIHRLIRLVGKSSVRVDMEPDETDVFAPNESDSVRDKLGI